MTFAPIRPIDVMSIVDLCGRRQSTSAASHQRGQQQAVTSLQETGDVGVIRVSSVEANCSLVDRRPTGPCHGRDQHDGDPSNI